jgi:tetratricopeptide (TPR) repeat protein
MSFRIFLCSVAFNLCIISLSHAADLSELQVRAEQATGQEIVEVLNDLDSFLGSAPENYAALFLKARLLEKTNRADDAEKLYQQLIELDPRRPEAYNNLAKLRAAEGDLAGAQSLLEKAIKANPSYATVYENLSQLYVAMARDSYGKALRLKTEDRKIALSELKEVTGTDSIAMTEPSVPPQSSPQQSPLAMQEESKSNVKLNIPEQATATSKAAEQALAVDKNEIVTTLQGWAAAWSEQATDVYLVFYTADYHPPGQSRQGWEQERRSRLKKPDWIRVALKDINVEPINNKEAKVEFTQIYQASNYQDKTRKQLMLKQTPDGWRISAEKSVARIN